ncbi:uncharacterized protein LOC116298317 [Actinia tenebrosa]|uniref:Uncharacterized protein LOC116298317 n=1 Tax=Actinia tenebrosa TaxID=6105 RepID=A0A6P8I215_ACTTE|nr:uncharacterized protein LOC116298317 [Actinia tenebrosa]
MVSFRRLIVSKLWTIRRGKWLQILLAFLVFIGVKFVLQDITRIIGTPEVGNASPNVHDVQTKGLNQKNYKLAWLGHEDVNLNEKIRTKGKHGVRYKENHDELSINSDDQADQNKSMYTKRKFIFAFRYYEQLGRATNNLLALTSWAKYRGSLVVSPFVNNSRMSGLSRGVSHFLRATSTMRFGPLDEYYNVPKLNQNLQKHGYGTLASFVDFENECHHRLNIVIHFLYSDPDSLKDAAEWYRKTFKEMRVIYSKAKVDGWLPCPFVRHSRLQKQLRFKVSRYVCVDPDIIRTPEELEEKVIQSRQCVGVVLWKGTGKSRTHFPLASPISHPLSPSDVDFNPTLVKIAKDFVREKIGSNFIAIHVRIERHYSRLGMNVTYRCMKKLINRITEARKHFKINKIFLASDLPVYGSDTFKPQDSLLKDREVLLNFLLKELDFPITYKPVQIYDTGSIAIIEMNILAAGEKIYTLGGGNFQEWILNLFRKKQGGKSRNIHRLCELT